nr:immunoglobulin heavy chain junction region [Mus musculus]MBK4188459.1 immunoglobulin heavy chain junction region [Mus musculus]MBK4188460.1 immunoglobulin heavy chain junction region [Mus musculus]
CARTPLFDFW